MTRTSFLSLRPALALAAALAAITLLFVASQKPAEAGGENTLAVSPALRNIGVGGTGSVELVSTAPAATLAAWVVDITFDPAVVSFSSCTNMDSIPQTIAVSDCGARDDGGSPDDDTAVAVGALLYTDTELGLDGTTTLASFEFDAVGAVGSCTDLTITVRDHLDPDGVQTNPTLVHGEICITAGETFIWGDFDCNDTVDPVDSLKLLRENAGLSVSQTEGCPLAGSNVTVDGQQRIWGDIDCGGSLDAVDSLKTLRFNAGLSVAQANGCPAPGSEVVVA